MIVHVRSLFGSAALLLVIAGAGCRSVDQEKEIAEWRNVVDVDAPSSLEPLAPGEHLTLSRAFALANRDNERIGFSGED